MHFFSRNKALIAASLAAVGVLSACGDDVTVPAAQVGAVTISLTPQNASVNIGESIMLSAQITGGSTTTPPTLASCTSSNTATLTVTRVGNACQVTGVAAGNASVTAKASTGQEASALVVVNAAAASISGLTVSPTSQNIAVGQTFTVVPNVTKAAAANTVQYSYVSSAPTIASVNAATGVVTAVAPGTATITVTATGSGTGYSNTTLTQGVTVQVTSAPSAVTNVTINPPSLALAVSQNGQITATVNSPAGAPANTISYTSSNTNVASVSATGLVTGVSQGNATISVRVQNAGNATLGAFDQTFAVPVTVSAPATLAIANVLQGPTVSMDSSAAGVGVVQVNNVNQNAASDVLNTKDQIQVVLNVTPNGQQVDSVVVFVADNQNSTGLIRAQGQVFAGPTNATSTVSIPINTAEFTINSTTGTATPTFTNGVKYFYARIYSRNSAGVSVAGQTVQLTTPHNFNNIDGWAIQHTLPSRTAQGTLAGNANLNWYGGPAAAGQGNYTIVPVTYTAGRTVRTATTSINALAGAANGAGPIAIGAGVVACGGNTVTFTNPPTAQPWRVTYGSTALPAANAINCAGYEHGVFATPTNAPVVSAAIDNSNAPYPTVSQPRGYRVSASVMAPAAVRLDYAGPAVVAPTVVGAEGFNWVNHAWSFMPAGTKVTDAGVGPLEASWAAFASANGGSASVFPTAISTGADLAETNQNCTGAGCDGYNARATANDGLLNVSNSAVTAAFGDDKTSPLLRYSSAATAPVSTSPLPSIYNFQGTSSTLDSIAGAPNNTYAAFNGVYGVNVLTAGAQERYLGTAAGAAADSMRIESLDNRSGLSRAVVTQRRFAQGGATGTTVNTGCQTTSGVFGASFGDGWRPGPQVHVTCGSAVPGYYTTTMWSVDRAGNVSGSTAGAPSFTGGTNPAVPGSNNANLFYRRTLALDPAQPQITGVSPNNNYTGNSQQTWSLGSQDDLEVIDARLRIQYPNVTAGDAGATASPGLVWSYALSNTMMPAGTGFSAGPASGNGANFGFFAPIATRFDASIVNPQVSTLTQDLFTLNVQETCIGANSPVVAPTACAGAGDPIASASVAFARPTNLAVQVRDVFGSWIFNTTPSATTGVSSEFVSPILPATVAAPGGYTVGYSVVAPGCPQFGGAAGGPCVTSGVNFRADGAPAASVRNFRLVQSLSVTLPIFTRIELYGLNAANEWVFIQRCAVPANINPAGGAQSCGAGTITGTDNGLERYWVVSFTGIPTAGFSQFRALGVNSNGFGLFSTRQP